MTAQPDARPADRIPIGASFRRAELARLRAARDRLARRLAFAEAARDAAATRPEMSASSRRRVSARVDALKAAG
jgi:hypothetical protein